MTVDARKIRVENQAHVSVSTYRSIEPGDSDRPVVRPFTVLLIKPYQKSKAASYGPPIGILTLAAGLRTHFGDLVTVHVRDMLVYNEEPAAVAGLLEEFRPDVVGVSALNCEARASYDIAAIVRAWNPQAITVIGGPFTLRQAPLIFSESVFNWVFEGAADRTFLQALERQFSGAPLGSDIPGFSHRDAARKITHSPGQDLITDLDSIPMPAWDLFDFERYRKRDRPRIITNVTERRYAYLFTSRGCPYLCSYCHDVFTKRFVYQSDERVLAEIELLYESYGVTEFHVVDDIFNLHKPRVRSLMGKIRERWGGKLLFAFPNGLRGDILDAETIQAMVDGGTYQCTISIETVTPRLQTLVEKYLDIPRAQWAIEEFARHGVIVQGAFMLGFPTETPEEIEATLAYAIASPLTHAFFFAVMPQTNTPIYDLALGEAPEAMLMLAHEEREIGDYNSMRPWYSRAYGYDLQRRISRAFIQFYFHPRRLWRLLKIYPLITLAVGTSFFGLRYGTGLWRVVVRRFTSAAADSPAP